MPPIANVIAVIAAVFSTYDGMRKIASASASLTAGLRSSARARTPRGSRISRHVAASRMPGIVTR